MKTNSGDIFLSIYIISVIQFFVNEYSGLALG